MANPLSRATGTLVTSPADMARVLRNASAVHAPAYALAAHETACATGDDTRSHFWSEVCRDLVSLCEQDEREAA